ncbi:hypothetical protein [Microvirga rosea]|uniref:hypothetical protein n=1 Tax=Microvirga rosea TaxID=2715425 RepID=UPI001D0B3454|nr:hypothetical protein [Microvirga rosea]MCB8819944.1 hypothetical protein [Microvirga rosea]
MEVRAIAGQEHAKEQAPNSGGNAFGTIGSHIISCTTDLNAGFATRFRTAPTIEQSGTALRHRTANHQPTPHSITFAYSRMNVPYTRVSPGLAPLARSMNKIDFKKDLSTIYTAPTGSFAAVNVPTLQYIKVDGKGDPNCGHRYRNAIEWLYSVSSAMKFAAKTNWEGTTSFRCLKAFDG